MLKGKNMYLKEKKKQPHELVQQFKMQNKAYLPKKEIHINPYESPRLQIVMEKQSN